MTEKASITKSDVIAITATVGMALAVVYLAFQNSELSSRIDWLSAEVSRHEKNHQETAEAAASQLAKLREQVDSLKHLPQTSPVADVRPTVEALSALETGYYELQTTTAYNGQSLEVDEYSISHVAVDVSYEGFGTKLQAGLALRGLYPIGVYFDSNSDGELDSEMAIEFVRDIPIIGRRLANAYDPEVAQSLYSIFMLERGNASFTSSEDMADDAIETSGILWSYVMDNYDMLAAWLAQMTEDPIDEPPLAQSE
jgi:hypothetical protein